MEVVWGKFERREGHRGGDVRFPNAAEPFESEPKTPENDPVSRSFGILLKSGH